LSISSGSEVAYIVSLEDVERGVFRNGRFAFLYVL